MHALMRIILALMSTLLVIDMLTFAFNVQNVETEETQTMLQMGFVREFTRSVQALRKKANLQKSDRIALFVFALASSQAALQNQTKEISQKVGASSIDFVALKTIDAKKNKDKLSVKNFEASFGF